MGGYHVSDLKQILRGLKIMEEKNKGNRVLMKIITIYYVYSKSQNICYTRCMNLKEALKEIKRLEQENKTLSVKHQDLADEHEKTLRLLF